MVGVRGKVGFVVFGLRLFWSLLAEEKLEHPQKYKQVGVCVVSSMGFGHGHRHGARHGGRGRIGGHRHHRHGFGGHRRAGHFHFQSGLRRRGRRRRQHRRHRVQFRRTLGRNRVGNDFSTIPNVLTAHDFSLFAGGDNDFVGRNLFMLQWRRAHSYIAPPIGDAPSGHDFWRSQLPPDGPNFVAINANQLGFSGHLDATVATLTACCMTPKLGGRDAVMNLLQPLHVAMSVIPNTTCCCGLLAGGPDYLQRHATLVQWLTNVNSGLTFNAVLPPNTPPGSLLIVQQPDGQTLQIQLPMVYRENQLRVLNGKTTISVPMLPATTPNGTNLPHNCVAHLLSLEEDVQFLILETPPVLCPGAGQPLHYNPLWSGQPPNLTPPEQQFIGNNYARARNITQQGVLVAHPNFQAELRGVGQVLDQLPPTSMWMTAAAPNNGAAHGNGNGNGNGLEMATAVPVVAPPANDSFQVIIPPNAGQGDSIVVQAPSGCTFSVELPPGAEPGTALMVSMPNAWEGEPTTRLVSAIDMDDDGLADVVGLDTTGDGQHDTYRQCVLVDTNGDGVLDSMSFDSTGDGQHDTIVRRKGVLHQSSTGESIDVPIVLAASSNVETVPMVPAVFFEGEMKTNR